MSLTLTTPAADDPEPHLFKALQAMRGARLFCGAGLVTIELVTWSKRDADRLAAALRAALEADKVLGETMA